jgi:S-adenosylmethionine:tRNA ribosyltransferase-isomerase
VINFFDPESYAYELPERQIAQNPIEPRDHSRLLIARREKEDLWDGHFYDLPQWIKEGDLLVVNDTKVIPARLRGRKKTGTAEVEILLLHPLDLGWKRWEALVRPGRRLKEGAVVLLPAGQEAGIGPARGEGAREVVFSADLDVRGYIDRYGEVPLPPYIHSSQAPRDRYQTVYACQEGSAAAPTAGLHFTPSLLALLQARGVEVARVTLHVGPGTFRPVKERDIRLHAMHEEWCELPAETVEAIRCTRQKGGRVIAVGTTVVRTLESFADPKGFLTEGVTQTRLFIYPGYRFRIVDALITNFHLPRSTLLMLVSAFLGYDKTMTAYRHAIESGYRFFSFGDAMAIF